MPPLNTIVVFWSWQSDSPADANRNFIQNCLAKACKAVGRDHCALVEVDRDTAGVGGSPAIADTILKKIRGADVFVWDATLVSLQPKPSPNPNVLFELGYAFAVLGEGRLIGVMNTSGVPKGTPLPFDLTHRRWPISYSMEPRTGEDSGADPTKKSTRDELTRALKKALTAAIAEPKSGAFLADVDFYAARTLWNSLDSEVLRNWHEAQSGAPQYESSVTLTAFEHYIRLADKPENRFRNETLAARHLTLVECIERYITTSATERVPHEAPLDSPRYYVISTKSSSDYLDDYDERYDAQLETLGRASEAAWKSWCDYVEELRARYPELLTTERKDA